MTAEDVQRANLAERLLMDDVFLGILRELKNDVIRDWADGKDVTARERAHAELHAIGRLENKLAAMQGELRIEAEHDRVQDRREKLREQQANGPLRR
jgi:hypothetical protein